MCPYIDSNDISPEEYTTRLQKVANPNYVSIDEPGMAVLRKEFPDNPGGAGGLITSSVPKGRWNGSAIPFGEKDVRSAIKKYRSGSHSL